MSIVTIPAKRLLPLLFLLPFTAAWLAGGLGSSIDRTLYVALHGTAPWLIGTARFATTLGSWAVLLPLSIAGALWLFWTRRRQRALLLLVTTLGGRLVISLMKDAVDRPRPILSEHLVAVQSASFPSGHAGNSMIVLLALALLLPGRHRMAWAAAALCLTALIGLSRVVLGVHWPSDVIGGWTFGLAWTLTLAPLTERPVRKA